MAFSLKAVFGLDATGVKTEIRQLRRELNSFVNDYAKLGAGVAVGIFTALSKGALDLAASLKDTALQVGINVESLQALHYAATQNGSSVESMNKALEKLRLNVREALEGNKAYTEALKTLGLTSAELIRLPLEQQYARVARATAGATDKTAAYNAVSQLFGTKIGPDQIAVLQSLARDGFDKTAQAAANAGQVMQAETVAALEAASQAIDDFKKRATIAVGNILVNFRSEEGLKLLLYQFLKVAGTFGGRILDALSEANQFVRAVMSSTFGWVVDKFRDGWLDSIAAVARQLNKILPSSMEINIAGIEALKSAGESVSERIARAIADTKPSTFAKDIGEFWDGAIKEQQAVVNQLNNLDFKKPAAELRGAGKELEKSGKQAAADLAAGGKSAGDDITRAADEARKKLDSAFDSMVQATGAILDRTLKNYFGFGAMNGASMAGLETETLEEIVRRNRAAADALDNRRDPITNIDYNIAERNRLNVEALNAQREPDLRANFQRAIAGPGGVNAARSQFDPVVFEKLLRQFGPGAEANKQTNLLTDIREQLKRNADSLTAGLASLPRP